MKDKHHERSIGVRDKKWKIRDLERNEANLILKIIAATSKRTNLFASLISIICNRVNIFPSQFSAKANSSLGDNASQ